MSSNTGVGTGIRELTRGLVILPQKVDPGALSALLGDLLGVSRSRERDLLSVLLIYPRIFLRVFIAYHLLVGFLYV